jgi:hypothetical protein
VVELVRLADKALSIDQGKTRQCIDLRLALPHSPLRHSPISVFGASRLLAQVFFDHRDRLLNVFVDLIE